MKCPFVNAVSKGLFQRSNMSLSSAINHCPFIIQQQRTIHESVSDNNNVPVELLCAQKTKICAPDQLRAFNEQTCPYTNGEVTPGSRCPMTGIDVSRRAHSEVLQKIHVDTPVTRPPQTPTPTIPKAWKTPLDEMIEAKKIDDTYRNFSIVNKDTKRTPTLEKVVRNRAFPLPRESYCSNDYLNMSSHPKVIEASQDAAAKHGTGAGGTRNIAGTSELTNALEMEIKDWHNTEDALIFNGCYVANDATLSTLLGRQFPDAQCFSDAGNHRSMIEGMVKGKREQKNPNGRIFPFKHDDPDDLERILSQEWQKNPDIPRIVAFESVHSMGGNIQKVEELCDIAHKYGALTFCDEVHAVGLYGRTGAGIAEERGIQHKIDIVSGTLGKGVGGFGGYIAGSSSVVDMIRQYAPGFIFTTAMPPPTLASNITSIRVLKSGEGRNLRAEHWRAVKQLRQELDDRSVPYKKPYDASHVTAVELGSAQLADDAMSVMDKYGFHVQSIKHPTVPKGEEMLRITVSPLHLRYPDIIPRFARKLAQTINAY